jgi:hypothetical protein
MIIRIIWRVCNTGRYLMKFFPICSWNVWTTTGSISVRPRFVAWKKWEESLGSLDLFLEVLYTLISWTCIDISSFSRYAPFVRRTRMVFNQTTKYLLICQSWPSPCISCSGDLWEFKLASGKFPCYMGQKMGFFNIICRLEVVCLREDFCQATPIFGGKNM